MALVRILVDGYSLLHSWPELAPGRPRHSAAARDALIKVLTDHQDITGTPITIFFDGAGSRRRTPDDGSRPAVEVLYSQAGQTADQLIERAAYRFTSYGEVLAVTNDVAERETVQSVGGMVCNCENFRDEVEGGLRGCKEDLKNHNRREQHRFARNNPRRI